MPQLDPDTLAVADRYKLLIGCVTPRPIAFVSTISPGGRANLAPFSFFNACGSDPMLLMFCPANTPDGGMKDSLRNAMPTDDGGTGCFVINLAQEKYTPAVAGAAEPLPHGESEFGLVGLTPALSSVVTAPRVAESDVSFECETWRIIRTNEASPDAPTAGNIVIGRVVCIHVADGVLNDRMHADPDALRTVGRMGGKGYCTTRDRFELPVGRAALDASPPHTP
ncbi:MAG: flavin reductase family protein [Planctomycetota bacterium]